jgi:hypothetical protein
MYRAKPTDEEDTLYLSPQSRELLRQVLRLDELQGETALVGAVKEALRMQYSRGFHEGMAEGAKNGGGLSVKPPPWTERRELSESPHKKSASSAQRQRARRHRRLRRRLRKAMVTTVILVLGLAGLLAFNATRPELSANNPRARHKIDWYPHE